MFDSIGTEIHTGDIVYIAGAYHKNENGAFLVTHSPGDPSWSGDYHSLTRLNSNGSLSAGKYRTNSWPLHSYVNSRVERYTANAWNAEHASIVVLTRETCESVGKLDFWLAANIAASKHFFSEASDWTQRHEFGACHFGNDSTDAVLALTCKDFNSEVGHKCLARHVG